MKTDRNNIEKLFTCGCSNKYSNRSALGQHIVRKHNYVVPLGSDINPSNYKPPVDASLKQLDFSLFTTIGSENNNYITK